MNSGLPPRGSFSAQMASVDASRVVELPLMDDVDALNAALHDRLASSALLPAPSPSPPPPPPPTPPVLPFKSSQRVRVKSVSFPPQSRTNAGCVSRQVTATETSASGSRARSMLSTAESRGALLLGSQTTESRTRGPIAASIISGDVSTVEINEDREREAVAPPHSTCPPSLIPSPSVHPVDTLSKKLRQQAEELTRVYEQLATQREQMKRFKSEVQSKKLEIERLKLTAKRRDAEANAPSRRSTASSARGAAPSSGTGAVTKATLDRKLKEAEQAKHRYTAAAKQLEQAIADARCFFRERRVDGREEDEATEDPSMRATQDEQRAYIRVLEEVVHLKASEFQVSSHEELIVVLAELRHTIYEQEKELQHHQELSRDAEARLLEEKQACLQIREQLDSKQREWDHAGSSARAHESEMRRQFLGVQRELERVRGQLQEALATCNELRARGSDLEQRAARDEAELETARAKLEQSARSSDEAKEKLAQALARSDDASRQAKHWESEAARRQTHLDEMNALQEELLDSIAETSAAQERASGRTKALEQALRDAEQREKETATKLEELSSRTGREQQQLKQRLEELKQLNEQVGMQSEALRERTRELDASLSSALTQVQEHEERADDAQQRLEKLEEQVAQHREAAAQLDAALLATLHVIAVPGSPARPSNSPREVDETLRVNGKSDKELHRDLVDASAVCDVRACCAALDSLLAPDDNESTPSWSATLLPSLRALLSHLVLAGNGLLSEIELASESWERERRDLRDACTALEEASSACKFEMDRRHRQLLDCQRSLADRELQVQVMVIESTARADQLVELQAAAEEKKALEQRVSELESEQSVAQAAVSALEHKLYARRAAHDDLTTQLRDARGQLEQRVGQLGELEELRSRTRSLSSELHEALSLSEEQNAWNEQLASTVARQEQETAAHCALIRELEAHMRAFARRFSQVFEQFAIESELGDLVVLSDGVLDHSDVLKLLQAFPAVVEQYVDRCAGRLSTGELLTTVGSPAMARSADPSEVVRRTSGSGRLKRLGGAREAGIATEKTEVLAESGSDSGSEEERQPEEQLKRIRAAFASIRER